jgi:hypothetical protein
VVTLSGLDLDAAGDQIIAYQGSAATPTVLYLVDFGDGNNTLAGDATDGNSTALPPGVTLGSGAVAVAFNNAVYAGTTTGTPAQVFAAISDVNNWSGSDSAQQEARQEAFFQRAAAARPSISTPTIRPPSAPMRPRLTRREARGHRSVTLTSTIFAFDVDEVTITIAGNKMSGDRLSNRGKPAVRHYGVELQFLHRPANHPERQRVGQRLRGRAAPGGVQLDAVQSVHRRSHHQRRPPGRLLQQQHGDGLHPRGGPAGRR